MHAVKGIYKEGRAELVDLPNFSEVFVVFPEQNMKRVTRIGGLFKGYTIDYDAAQYLNISLITNDPVILNNKFVECKRI